MLTLAYRATRLLLPHRPAPALWYAPTLSSYYMPRQYPLSISLPYPATPRPMLLRPCLGWYAPTLSSYSMPLPYPFTPYTMPLLYAPTFAGMPLPYAGMHLPYPATLWTYPTIPDVW